jgi:hypothetical protein
MSYERRDDNAFFTIDNSQFFTGPVCVLLSAGIHQRYF